MNKKVFFYLSLVFLYFSYIKAEEFIVDCHDDYNTIITKLKPGDVLYLKPGIYKTGWVISGLKGTTDQPIRIIGRNCQSNVIENSPSMPVFRPNTERDGILFYGKPSEHVVIQGIRFENAKRAGVIIHKSSHIIVRECEFESNGTWGVQTCLSDYITVENCRILSSKKEHGIYFSTTDNPVARNNYIAGNNRCGIHMNGDKNEGGDGMISDGVIENNYICYNGRDGGAAINMDGVERTVVKNNVIKNNFAGGMVSFWIDGKESGRDNEFTDNFITFNSKEGRYGVKVTGSPFGVKILRNKFICHDCPAVEIDNSTGIISDQNEFADLSKEIFKVRNKLVGINEWRETTGQDKHSEVKPDLKCPEWESNPHGR